MTRMRTRLWLAVSLPGLLVACGGGGDDSAPSQEISTNNSTELTASALTAADTAGTTAQLSYMSYGASTATVNRMRAAIARLSPAANATEACPGGGSITLNIEDTNGTHRLDAVGESASFSFAQCAIPMQGGVSLLIDGGLKNQVTRYEGDYWAAPNNDWAIGSRLTFDDLSITQFGETASLDGSQSLDAVYNSTTDVETDTVVSNMNMSDGDQSIGLDDFTITATLDYVSWVYTYDLEGRMLLEGGALTVSTNPVLQSIDDAPISSGTMVLSNADGASITTTFYQGGATLAVDANGDGTVDATQDRTWAELGLE